jgi:hypothetical protein
VYYVSAARFSGKFPKLVHDIHRNSNSDILLLLYSTVSTDTINKSFLVRGVPAVPRDPNLLQVLCHLL